MKIEYVTGNLLDPNYKIFIHQVNCKGVMGAGLAKTIRNIYPEVYREYKRYCYQGFAVKGVILPVRTNDGRICVNMFAQNGYGGRPQTDYKAFKKCLERLEMFLRNIPANVCVAFPNGIGCGLAGGDWFVIKQMLEEFAEKVLQKVFIVKLEEK